MLSILYVRLTIKVTVGIPESFKVGWYPHKITKSNNLYLITFVLFAAFVLTLIINAFKKNTSFSKTKEMKYSGETFKTV